MARRGRERVASVKRLVTERVDPSLNEVKGEDGEAGSRARSVSEATCDRTRRLRKI